MRNPDNAPEKREEYRLRLETMTDVQLFDEAKNMIWFSAYAANNHNSCFHWKCDATYMEAMRRDAGDIYSRAHKAVAA